LNKEQSREISIEISIESFWNNTEEIMTKINKNFLPPSSREEFDVDDAAASEALYKAAAEAHERTVREVLATVPPLEGEIPVEHAKRIAGTYASEAVARVVALMRHAGRNAHVQLSAAKLLMEFAADAKMNGEGEEKNVRILVINNVDAMRTEAGRRNLRKAFKKNA
jgi:hypothetical protein